MRLSIVIVNYNVEQLVIDCVRSIYKYMDCIPFEIIVVDNSSDKRGIQAVRNEFLSIQIIENISNVGFSEANNQGMNASTGDYILLLNPDTYLIDDTICKMFEFARDLKQNAIVGPKLFNEDKSLQYSTWRDKDLKIIFQESLRIFKSSYPLETYTKPQPVDNVSGAAMLFSRKVAEEIGGFDKSIFWMEDFDFCYRARKAGVSVYYFPEASVVHLGGQSSEKNTNVAYANSLISKVRFYKKHHSKFNATIATALTFLHIAAYIMFLLLVSVFSKHYRNKLRPYLFTFRKFIAYLFNNNIAIR
jgi:N-acetylglucosaminyl-diphospho-decaprenol L-rhamnosyltransferase